VAEHLIVLKRLTVARPELDLNKLPADPHRLDAHAGEIVIRTHAPDETPLLIHRAYVEQLKADGWRGTEQIPAECLVDDPPRKGWFGA
jgi:hypothetical protein